MTQRPKDSPEQLNASIPGQEVADLLSGVLAMAKATWAFYEQLVKEGFTPEQALAIIKARGINMTGGF